MGTEEKVTKNEIRPIVMSVTVVLFIALLAAIVINADAFYDFLYNAVMNNAMWGLGWFSSVVCLVMVIFCVVVMVTPLGKVKLGGPNEKPKFTMMVWYFPLYRYRRRRRILGRSRAADFRHGYAGLHRN